MHIRTALIRIKGNGILLYNKVMECSQEEFLVKTLQFPLTIKNELRWWLVDGILYELAYDGNAWIVCDECFLEFRPRRRERMFGSLYPWRSPGDPLIDNDPYNPIPSS